VCPCVSSVDKPSAKSFCFFFQKEVLFFFEKKKQKTFAILGVRQLGESVDHTTKPGTLARLVLAADLAGTFLFGLEGALVAIRAHLDLLGITVIAMFVAMGGGIIRDVLLGDTPPAALRDQRYPLLAILAALAAVTLYESLSNVPVLVFTVLDAAGLSLFAVSGTQKAVEFGARAVTAAMLGTLTACGGGAARDVALNRIPVILHSDFYATAALAGSVVVIGALRAGASPRIAALAGGLLCFTLRMVGALENWQLPHFG
jgi:uncharacterized membrane protein YeiH